MPERAAAAPHTTPHMSENQKRTPAGVPTGGQFAASARDESGVSLSNDAQAPKAYTWSTDPDKVKPPKAAVALVSDAEAAGMDVKVLHGETTVEVALTSGRNSVSVTWLKGDYYDEPDRGKLPFRTGGTPTTGVRFYMANGRINGEYPTIRSARQARLYIGLPEK